MLLLMKFWGNSTNFGKTNIMTPKEKALELSNKYYNKIEHTISNEYSKVTKEITKQCALIAVEEIKEAIFWHPFESPNFELEYWQEVKQEIENL